MVRYVKCTFCKDILFWRNHVAFHPIHRAFQGGNFIIFTTGQEFYNLVFIINCTNCQFPNNGPCNNYCRMPFVVSFFEIFQVRKMCQPILLFGEVIIFVTDSVCQKIPNLVRNLIATLESKLIWKCNDEIYKFIRVSSQLNQIRVLFVKEVIFGNICHNKVDCEVACRTPQNVLFYQRNDWPFASVS